MDDNIQPKIDELIKSIGSQTFLEQKRFYIGKSLKIEAAIIFILSLSDKEKIEKNILTPLMLHMDEDITGINEKCDYLSKKYIVSSKSAITQDITAADKALKNGDTVLVIDKEPGFIIIDTHGGTYRQITEPTNEAAMKGSREGFVESIEVNISMIKRRIKDDNLVVENFIVGKRSQTRVSILYINGITKKEIYEEVKKRINKIDIDFITSTGMLKQYIEEKSYTIFPQIYSTERPDRIVSNIMEGKVVIIVDGDPSVIALPANVYQFFHTVDDYYSRVIPANALRILRYIGVFIMLYFSSIYLVLLKFNSELIPVQFIVPIVQSRSGISLTPFMEIVIMEFFIELLREGGLRLPSKIAQTLSIVGGIIIGDAAVKSNMVSPTTLLVVGVTVVASFLIPNYEMSVSIRFLRFVILLIANFTGILGISVSFILIITHLSAFESYGVPYMSFYKKDLKDIIVRAPLWQLNERPTATATEDKTRQKNSGDPIWSSNDEKKQ